MTKQIIYRPNYLSLDLVTQIRHYFDRINDSLLASNGPRPSKKLKLGWTGCWDRQLHFELKKNPIHQVVNKLKQDFGDFFIYESSIRYLSAPFVPHSDIRDPKWLNEFKTNGFKEHFIFLIPLWWKEDYTPGTAFFNSPAKMDEPLYSELSDILPEYNEEWADETKNFSVREVIKWQSPGDLIAWENFQWHSSCHFGNPSYDQNSWVKEFISIECFSTSTK